jgi:hypothetical protein
MSTFINLEAALRMQQLQHEYNPAGGGLQYAAP